MKRIFTFLCCITIALSSFNGLRAESGKEKRLYKKANRSYMVGDYGRSIPLFKDLVLLSPNNFAYNYKLGVSYFYSSNASDKLNALPFFEAALKNMKDTLPEIYYYLGRTYQIAHKFQDAIEMLNILKEYVGQSQSAIKDIEEIDNYISQCNTAAIYIKTPLQIKINNLGKNVNSESADYAPAISGDESILVFTSKRKGTTGGKIDDDGKYYEDVYISKRVAGNSEWKTSSKIDSGDTRIHLFKSLFSDAEKISTSINTRDHDASISLTTDGKALYLYRKSDIWKSEATTDGKWSRPARLPEVVNSKKYHEPSVSQSSDGTTLYIVSERPGGFGGKDIYKSKKQADGSWSSLENLGSTINTRFDDDSPFIHPDGKTLYFSSEGHKSMGGFDIFQTKLQDDGSWSSPINIGYPINTAADDIFFVLNAKGDHAYFSSIQGENFGDLDIYLVSPPDVPNASQNLQTYLGVDSAEAKILATTQLINKIDSLSKVSTNGKVFAVIKNNGSVAEVARLKITERGDNEDPTNYVTSSSLGQKLYTLPSGNQYALSIESQGYPDHTLDIFIPKSAKEVNYYQEIQFEDIKEKGVVVGRKAKIYTVLADMDSLVALEPSLAGKSKEQAYSEWLKMKSKNYTSLSPLFKVTSFTDYISQQPIASNDNNEPTKTVQFKPILFDFAKSLVREDAVRELDSIYKFVSENKDVRLEIYGHTDSKGSEQFNVNLSQKRASATKKHFTDKGILATRIKTIGRGESQPIAPNENPDKTDNPEGRQLNRRVEFKIVPIKK